MRVLLVLVLVLGACGRIGFDPVGGGDGQPPSNLHYDRVWPVYITGHAMPALVPVVTGTVSGYTIAPPLPAGIQIDPISGILSGTPAVAQVATPYTVTAFNAFGQTSTTIRLRTADGYIVNDSGNASDTAAGDARCEIPASTSLCTLRAAVEEVNAAGGTKNVIFVLAQTIALSTSLPDVVQTMEIVGEDTQTAIVDGNGVATTNFGANNISLSLAYLTVRNSVSIAHNFRTSIALVLDHMYVARNAGFVTLGNTGTATLTDSTFDGNIDNVLTTSAGPVTIDRCSFINNTTSVNGLLYFVFDTATITSSTFAGNSGNGSAVVIDNATVTLANNTFAGNTATDSFRGGAVTQFSGGTSTWTNNLIASNTGSTGNCSMSGSITSNGGNLMFPASSQCQLADAADRPVADPLLAPVADNGGPTPTMALGAGSPAIDTAISSACPATDQRGVARPLGVGCDIGAVEQQ